MIGLTLSLVLLGDSITFGIVSFPPGPSYAELLSAAYDVVNLGIGPTTTREWVPLADVHYPGVPEHLPAVVTILLGTGDAVEYPPELGGPIEPPEYAENMAALVAALLDDGATRVIVMTPPPNFALANLPHFPRRLLGYQAAVLDLCEPPGDKIVCGPDLHALLEPSDFQQNNVHPNWRGHSLIASELAAVIPEPRSPASALLVLVALRVGRSYRKRNVICAPPAFWPWT